ncbi:hypothetical protein HPB49_002858 [Dermacentor silvarum]|uniref:Uncharacterized protein n=1 Tax=Dermacentor silvarum TaxID=543639 RepID=A0ACB8CJ72_DERSI|nr:hypothetical protein HPB49_002858 [Dermacentor silvarum]
MARRALRSPRSVDVLLSAPSSSHDSAAMYIQFRRSSCTKSFVKFQGNRGYPIRRCAHQTLGSADAFAARRSERELGETPPALRTVRDTERMATSSEEMDSSAEELPATLTTSAIPNEQEDKTGRKVVISRKTKKEHAETTAPQQAQHTSGGQVSSSRTPPNSMNRVIRASRMPPLRQDNIKIVLRPKGGLNIQKIGPTSVNKYADVRAIRIAGKEYAVSAYETAPSDSCKVVIRYIDTADDHRTIERNIVNDHNPLALAAKRIKNSGSVIIVFDGLHVPNFVRNGPTLVLCSLYRKQVDICYVYGKLGHRADVCPEPGSTECRGCGLPNPTSSHVCDPKWKLCGGLHATADKVCKKRYLIPYVVRARRQRARLEQQGKAQLVEEEKQHAERGRSTSKTPGRSRSRSRSRSHTPARTSRSRSRSQVRFGGKNNGGDGTWADKVRGATTTTPKESESCNPDKERIAVL